jgi:hypothetical protein
MTPPPATVRTLSLLGAIALVVAAGLASGVPGEGGERLENPDESATLNLSRSFHGSGAWVATFELAKDHDFAPSDIQSQIVTGSGFGVEDQSPAGKMTVLLNESDILSPSFVTVGYDEGQLAYVTNDGDKHRIDPAVNEGGGVRVWNDVGGLAFGQTVQIVFIYDAPSAQVFVNATGADDILSYEELDLSDERVATMAKEDFASGTSAGAYFAGSASLNLSTRIETANGLLGFFTPDPGFEPSQHRCSAPGSPETCYVGSPLSNTFFQRGSGEWGFHIDEQVDVRDRGLHVLFAAQLPPIEGG